MNVLVTGANGQLGKCVRESAFNADDRYFYTDVDTLDITDREAIRRFVVENHIDCIVNCAAYTNVDKAEEPDQFELAKKINCDAAGNLAAVAKENDALLIHISTDYVFGGNVNNTPCDEEQQPNPTGVYGLTKLMGENEIVKSGCRHIILRTAWLYSEYGNNFVKTILRLTGERESIKVVIDQCGTPTYARDLADAIVGILGGRLYEGKYGIYNYSNLGVCSWYDFARMIRTISGAFGCEVAPCRSAEFPSKVKRPAYSVLDKTKFINTFGIEVPYWVDSLQTCLNNLMSQNN